MKRTVSLKVVILLCALSFGACHKQKAAEVGQPTTQTIAPAQPPPTPPPTGTDAMTQTVDVEDGRSEDEGGALTNGQTARTDNGKPAVTTTQAAPARPKAKH